MASVGAKGTALPLRVGFPGMQSVVSQGFMFDFMFCCHQLEILITFSARNPTFILTGPQMYVAAPASL